MISTVLDGIRQFAGPDAVVRYARGADIHTDVPDPAGEFFPDGQPRPHVLAPCPPDPTLIGGAVSLARESDVVVAVLGDTIALVGEGRSTATLEFFGAQMALLAALVETGTPVVLVVLASKPHVLPPSAERTAAIVWAANPGMEGGNALAEVLFGQVEPSGRLPISWPRHVGQQPTFYNQIDAQHGYRYADLTQEPQFVFGEGLSYSSVAYSELGLELSVLRAEDTVRASVTVANAGARPVLETVQAYVRDVNTSATWADRELKAFTQVSLAPGESARVSLEVPVSACTIVTTDGRRVVEPGAFELLVGPSSRLADLLVAPFDVKI
jgi:beta-glucosidase